ncbi:hypothetical protein QAD02_005802 [Eretmocerus hayati]|uniref:Uncharacterized protein n=1 Tax=Eretmocerus hayati TaxID=131215 RepID=A0ACC2NTJ1_9HYME|nr:hypothetical protein QAD02_005802 [Eretmocerus hayati]
MQYTEILSFVLGFLLTSFLWLNWWYFEDRVFCEVADLTLRKEGVRGYIETQVALEITGIKRELSLMEEHSVVHEEGESHLKHDFTELRSELLDFEKKILNKIQRGADSRIDEVNDQECCAVNLSTKKCTDPLDLQVVTAPDPERSRTPAWMSDPILGDPSSTANPVIRLFQQPTLGSTCNP